MYNRYIEARSCNHWCSGKAMSVIYYECVFLALVIRHATRTVLCPALQYFSTLSHKLHNLKKNFIENKICVLIFSTIFV